MMPTVGHEYNVVCPPYIRKTGQVFLRVIPPSGQTFDVIDGAGLEQLLAFSIDTYVARFRLTEAGVWQWQWFGFEDAESQMGSVEVPRAPEGVVCSA